MHHDARYQQAKKTTIIGAVINALLALLKLVGGVIFHSHALIADGIHSISDLFTDLMVIVASKYGSQEADESHPYGHQRIETAATLLLALLLILAGVGIAWDAFDEILHGTLDTPQVLALPVALLSIIANEGLFHYTLNVGKKINSDLLMANAWHHRSDAASSVVVLIGLMGAIAGYHYWDAVAAIIVGGMIVKMGLSYGWDSVKELVDTAVEPETLSTIERVILSHDGVKKIHQLRSRMMGRDIFVDVHLLVSSTISVSEGHFIAQKVHDGLIHQVDNIKDVTIHVDPEDDHIACPSVHLPERHLLETHYLNQWKATFPGISDWVLHYLDGKLYIDLICTPEFSQVSTLENHIRDAIQTDDNICDIRVLQSVTIKK